MSGKSEELSANPAGTDYISLIYDAKRTPKTEYPHRLAHYLSSRFRLQAGEKFLELGCGRGDFLKAFKELGFTCHGVDREESAKAFNPGIEIAVCDIEGEKLPFPDAFFDVVYHKSLIEHVYSPRNLMMETHRVLKPGGKCIILTPDWVSQMQVFYEDITHCRPYDTNALRDAFCLFGFDNIVVERFRQLPVLWKSNFLSALARIMSLMINVRTARSLTRLTGVKFFRWGVELMVLGYGEKRG
ncbi:MAG TPA: class I SAM-dependent methyltransferase [Bryobacteraceae bacterium]|nr:class I SAM-dependent methyltransferase [Bryobacteraceae bacterium]